MEIAIAVFIGVWFTLAGAFTTWMTVREFNKGIKQKETNKEDKQNG